MLRYHFGYFLVHSLILLTHLGAPEQRLKELGIASEPLDRSVRTTE